MPLDFETALSQYGYVGQMAAQNPELRPLLDQATREEWDSARFQRELSNTGWFQGRSERQREIDRLKAVDPGEWNAKLTNQRALIFRIATSMGIREVPNLDGVAQFALSWDFTEADIREWLLDYSGANLADSFGGFTGEAGEIEAEIERAYADYGLPITQQAVGYIAREILTGKQTTGGVTNSARNAAKQAFPTFAEQLDQGLTMRQIAEPFVATMANTLELSDTNLGLNDPHIKRALQGKDGKPLSLWEFERTLKDDARWQTTKQARNETYAVLQQVGQDWGFA